MCFERACDTKGICFLNAGGLRACGCVRALLRNPFDHAAIKRLIEGQQPERESRWRTLAFASCKMIVKNGYTRISLSSWRLCTACTRTSQWAANQTIVRIVVDFLDRCLCNCLHVKSVYYGYTTLRFYYIQLTIFYFWSNFMFFYFIHGKKFCWSI